VPIVKFDPDTDDIVVSRASSSATTMPCTSNVDLTVVGDEPSTITVERAKPFFRRVGIGGRPRLRVVVGYQDFLPTPRLHKEPEIPHR
jgi:hypothetical protein